MLSCFSDILQSNIFHIVSNIFLKGSIEKYWLLRDNSESTSKIVEVEIFDINVVQRYPTFLWLVESLEELQNCWFSTSWRSNESYFVSLFDLKIEMLKNVLFSLLIFKSDILNLDISISLLKFVSPWVFRLLIKYIKYIKGRIATLRNIWKEVTVVSHSCASQKHRQECCEHIRNWYFLRVWVNENCTKVKLETIHDV